MQMTTRVHQWHYLSFLNRPLLLPCTCSNTIAIRKPTTATAMLDNAREGGGDKITTSLTTRLLSHHKSTSLVQRILPSSKREIQKIITLMFDSPRNFFRSMLRPPSLWSTFPHSNHATLQSLLDRFGELHSKESSGNVCSFSLIFIEEGEYVAVVRRRL